MGINSPRREKAYSYDLSQMTSDFDGFFLDKRPKPRKTDMRFRTWNVRSLYRAG
jgi:hypothetical protein